LSAEKRGVEPYQGEQRVIGNPHALALQLLADFLCRHELDAHNGGSRARSYRAGRPMGRKVLAHLCLCEPCARADAKVSARLDGRNTQWTGVLCRGLDSTVVLLLAEEARSR
jgi:hypothetical protein